MSPFGRNKGDDQQQDQQQGQQQDSDPKLDAEVTRLQGLTLPQLASEVMTKGFSAQYDPTNDGQDAAGIADSFYARPDWSIRDSTVKAQTRAAQESSTPGTAKHQYLVLADVVAEGVQLLEHASLIRLKSNYDGQYFNSGYVATRLGQSALQSNTVDKVLAGGTP